MLESVPEEIRSFVSRNFVYTDSGRPLADDDPLIELGVVDSTGVLELMSFLEQQFGFKVQDEEIVEANFGTIAAMAAFVARKRAGRPLGAEASPTGD